MDKIRHGIKHNVLVAYKDYSTSGGAEKNLYEVSEYLSDCYDISFILTGGQDYKKLSAIGNVYIFPSRGRHFLLPLDFLYLAYLLVQKRFRLVHCHHRYPAFVASFIAPILRVKILTTVHNVFPDKSGVSRWGDRLIAVSEKVRGWLLKRCGVNPDLITVIYNGIDKPVPLSRNEIMDVRESLNISDHECVLCSIGRLSPQKNYHLLLDALHKINSREWSLLLIGEGELRTELEQYAEEMGIRKQVHFLGYRTDIPALLQASNFFVMSSEWEGFPYVVIEAMANRLAIVSTNVGGISEAVIDGENGFLVASGDAVSLSDRINQLIKNPVLRSQMADTGEQIFLDRFTADRMLNNIKGEYQMLLGET